jgi:UDP-GlcNAc:undecaprenyl-phosphate GlcNAc-1-phosphate transferase
MLDAPGKHKAHHRPIPMLGGSAIFAAILGVSLLVMALASYYSVVGAPAWVPAELSVHIPGAASKAPMALGILLGALVLHVVGLIDDRKDIGPWFKLASEIVVAALVVTFCNVRILTAMGTPVSIIVSVFWLVGITNAFNFLDNMDGLAAGVAIIVAAALLAAGVATQQVFVPAWLALIIGALGGFLLYNFPPASVFMGDAGSLVIGFLLGVLSTLTTYVHPGETYYAYGIFVPLVVMAVPLYDMVSVVTLRLKDRRHPMVGDRRHFSHRLIRRGMSVRSAVGTIYLCTVTTGLAASLLARVDATGAMIIFAQTLVILLVLGLLEAGNNRP